MTPSEYWKQLSFHTAETWSFHRPPKLDEFLASINKRIEAVKKELATARYMQQAKLYQEIQELEAYQRMYHIPLVNAEGNIHLTAVKCASFAVESEEADELGRVLLKHSPGQPVAACPPLYRDGIIFYNQEREVISVLNICLECHHLGVNSGEMLSTAAFNFVGIFAYLHHLGHPVHLK